MVFGKTSTDYAAVELLDRILNIMDGNDVPFGVFMDLSKAFDTIDHQTSRRRPWRPCIGFQP